MIEREMLDLVATRAPAPTADFAEDTLRRARRVRHRRLATAATGVVTAGAVVSFALLAGGGGPESHRETLTPGSSLDSPGQAYAAVIKSLTEDARHPGAKPKILYILDRLCADPAVAPPARCDGASLRTGLRTELTDALRSYAPVSYLSDPHTVTKKDTSIANDGAVIALGPLRISGITARVSASVRRDGLDGMGASYQLTLRDGRWVVTGTAGPGWIS